MIKAARRLLSDGRSRVVRKMCRDIAMAFQDVNNLEAIIPVAKKDHIAFEDRAADFRKQLRSVSTKRSR